MCDTNALLAMAARFRAHACETSLPEYQAMMLNTADTLEAIVAQEAIDRSVQAAAPASTMPRVSPAPG